jgi:hypothetical protein
MLSIPHCLDNRLTDGGEVVSLKAPTGQSDNDGNGGDGAVRYFLLKLHALSDGPILRTVQHLLRSGDQIRLAGFDRCPRHLCSMNSEYNNRETY